MNLSPEWTGYLSANGIETTHWSSLGNPAAPDEEILEFAAQHRYTVLTGDLDFGILAVTRSLTSPSVVQIRCEGTLPEAVGKIVVDALRAGQGDLLRGA